MSLPWRRTRVAGAPVSSRVPELNILPPKYQKIEAPPAVKRLTLLAILFGLLALVQLVSRTEAISDGFTRVRSNFSGTEDPSIEQERLLRVQVNNAQTKVTIKSQALAALTVRQVDWAAVFGEMKLRAPEGVTVTSVVQNPSRHEELDINGISKTTNLIPTFRDNLLNSDLFTGVAVRTIRGRSEGTTEFIFTIFLSDKARSGVKQ